MMKKTLLILAIAMMAIGASAQVRFGVKAGVGVNTLHIENPSSNFDTDNRTGFTGGVMMEVNLPLGIAVDASALYTRRSGAIEDTEVGVRDYIAVPVNLKYKLSLPVVSNIITPFAFTGPEFAFNVGNKKSEAGSEYKTTTVSWNVGLGVELVKHVQLSAAYCMGINKSITNVLGISGVESGAKDR